jgi:hypothetical protein
MTKHYDNCQHVNLFHRNGKQRLLIFSFTCKLVECTREAGKSVELQKSGLKSFHNFLRPAFCAMIEPDKI